MDSVEVLLWRRDGFEACGCPARSGWRHGCSSVVGVSFEAEKDVISPLPAGVWHEYAERYANLTWWKDTFPSPFAGTFDIRVVDIWDAITIVNERIMNTWHLAIRVPAVVRPL